MRRFAPSFALLLLLLSLVTIPGLGWAQVERGAIRGDVVDMEGDPLPGVRVTVTSPALVEPKTDAGDASGQFEFDLLPVGTYTVETSFANFAPGKAENVRVSPGGIESIRITMKLEPVDPSAPSDPAVGQVSSAAARGAVDSPDVSWFEQQVARGVSAEVLNAQYSFGDLDGDGDLDDEDVKLYLAEVRAEEVAAARGAVDSPDVSWFEQQVARGVSAEVLNAQYSFGDLDGDGDLDDEDVKLYLAEVRAEEVAAARGAVDSPDVSWFEQQVARGVSAEDLNAQYSFGDLDGDGDLDDDDVKLYLVEVRAEEVAAARGAVDSPDVSWFEQQVARGVSAEVLNAQYSFGDLDGDGDLDDEDVKLYLAEVRAEEAAAARGVAPTAAGEPPAAGIEVAENDLSTIITEERIANLPLAGRKWGDGDENGVIDQTDYNIWRTNFGNTGAPGASGDYNGNGVVDASDYVIWRNNAGGGVAGEPKPEAVPAGEIPILITALDFEGNPVTGTFYLPVDGGREEPDLPLTVDAVNLYGDPVATTIDLPVGGLNPSVMDNTQDVTWSSSNTAIASVADADPPAGSVTLIINALDVEGNAITGMFNLPIDGGARPVDPPVSEIPITVTALDSEGNPLTTTIYLPINGGGEDRTHPVDLTQFSTWSSNLPGVASVSDAGGDVLIRVDDDLNHPSVASVGTDPTLQKGGLEFFQGGDRGAIQLDADFRSPAPGGADLRDFADGPMIYVESLGGSTGEVFKVHVVNPGPEPLELSGYAAIEPAQIPPDGRARIVEQIRRMPGAHAEMMANFYCLEFLRQAPSAGIVYRIAGAAEQERFAPAARALEAARRLNAQGLLNADTNPESYFHSIRQWAVWTLEQGFDREKFLDAFLEHAKKNFARTGREWSDELETAVLRSAEGRWQDITEVLAEAR